MNMNILQRIHNVSTAPTSEVAQQVATVIKRATSGDEDPVRKCRLVTEGLDGLTLETQEATLSFIESLQAKKA